MEGLCEIGMRSNIMRDEVGKMSDGVWIYERPFHPLIKKKKKKKEIGCGGMPRSYVALLISEISKTRPCELRIFLDQLEDANTFQTRSAPSPVWSPSVAVS